MRSPWIAGLRSVALNVPDLEAGEAFYTRTWHLDVVAREPGTVFLRGTGPAHHVLSLHRADAVSIRDVTFAARSVAALQAVAERVGTGGGRIVRPLGDVAEPGGGFGVTFADADGRIVRVVHGDAVHPDAATVADRPQRLAHVVLNSRDVARSQAFFEQTLGFVLADRTRIMAFMNCNDDHHSVALGDADNDCLNHVAFLMPDLESVMRGAGRMRDAGFAIEWGPGRHGPGNNAFSYFVGPFDEVIEYTADVQQIDDDYRVGQPEDWTWPPGRVDRWGLSAPPTARLKAAQRTVRFMPISADPLEKPA